MTKLWCDHCDDMAEVFVNGDWAPCPAGCQKREPETEATPVPLVSEIQAATCEAFGLKATDMTSPNRARVVARPRQVAMLIARQLTRRSLPELAKMFGRIDHTTVLHGVRQIEQLIATDPELEEKVRAVRAGAIRRASARLAERVGV